MAEIIRMPDLTGDGKTGGLVLKWKKKLGDKVNKGEEFLTLETEEAILEVESFKEGILLYTAVEKDQLVLPNEVLAVIGDLGENALALIEQDRIERLNRNKR